MVENSNSSNSSQITEYVLSVVAEKTGYPTEMLDLELDLEADLGIDTVKQAELFATIRTHYGIPRREDLRLSEYNTLTKVIRFVKDGLVVLGAAPAETSPIPVLEQSSPESETSEKQINIRRRVPAAMIRPRLELCQPTGIQLSAGMKVLVVGGESKLQTELIKALKKLNVTVIGYTYADAEKANDADGIYFLAPMASGKDRSSLGFDLAQSTFLSEALYKTVRSNNNLKFFVSATFMGGLAGIAGEAAHPEQGIVSGFTKALAREREQLFAKSIDFQSSNSVKIVAERLIQETQHDPSNVEVGWENDLRFTFQLLDAPEAKNAKPIQPGSVFLVTGGTAGIIAPVVRDLAQATKGKFILLGRTELNSEVEQLMKMEKADLQQTVRKMLEVEGVKATPAAIEARIERLSRTAKTSQLMQAVRDLGGQAEYIQCDITSEADVQGLVQSLQKKSQPVDIVLHAAGFEKSRKIKSKTSDEFNATIAAKVEGFQNLLNGLTKVGIQPSRFVLFSSVAGRFGNSGQTDYSAANDALNKLAWTQSKNNPVQQWLSIDWGAWDEVGMASRGNIPHLMELAGIEMMPARQAAQSVRKELEAGTSGEIVISGLLGNLETPANVEMGIRLEDADAALRAGSPIHNMLSHLSQFSPSGEVHLEVVLDPVKQPFLRDHQLNGVPVLPGVIGIEGFSVAAKHIASVLAASSGIFEVAELEDIHFHAPFKFYRNEPRHVCWTARGIREDGGLVIHVTLESDLELRSRAPEHVLHFSGKVHLTTVKNKFIQALQPPVWLDKESICADDIYKLYFHGPSFQVLECAQRSGEQVLGKLTANLLPITDGGKGGKNTPLLVELCFQTAGLFEAGINGVMGLPSSIESLTVYREASGKGDLYAVVSPSEENGMLSFNAKVVDEQGNTYLELKNYRTSALPYSVEPELVAPLKVLLN